MFLATDILRRRSYHSMSIITLMYYSKYCLSTYWRRCLWI